AGTGLLLVRGAVKVMTGADLRFDRLGWLCQGDRPLQWLAGLAVAAMLLWATQRFQHFLVLPGVLLFATLLFYGAIWVYAIPLEVVRSEGWLLGPFPEGSLWHPLTWSSLHQVQWGAIAQSGSTLSLLVFVSLLSLVLTNGSLELALEKDLDLNRELKAVGLANMAAGLGSTMAGNQALPSTLLVYRLGAISRLTGLFKALPCLAVLVLGPTFLNYFPKPILGSLLLYLGLSLLWQWLVPVWVKLPKIDYGMIWVTLCLINAVGFMAGIGVGFGLAAIAFLIQCSRVQTVMPVEAGAAPDGGTSELPDCKPNSDAIAEVGLRGCLFFGTAKALRQQLGDRILRSDGTSPQYLLLDFSQVISLDSSAVISLDKVTRLAEKHDCTLVFCGLGEAIQQRLISSQTIAPASGSIFPSRDRALVHCHAQLQSAPDLASDLTDSGDRPRPEVVQKGALELSELLP
ncbi:sodium-independent anion transporter, partial [filamentous cyanobacterium CCP5]